MPNTHDSNGLYLFPVQTYTTQSQQATTPPYMELSFGIENIFKILEIDYVRRLTYCDTPGINKHGVRLRLHIQF